MSAIDTLIKRVEDATKARSKEIRLPASEAQRVVFELTRLLGRENELLQKIIELQENNVDKLPRSATVVDSQPASGGVVMDGGGFKEG